ncbi:MAG TPA: ABC transporter substrate-binding protein [Candidatus Krumholzibacteria bacterium]|nr:ABC transporter substrate-binding protein [Candidatus Krumholzibacteria bacterium]HRX50425.1 ABC transporter substrate-binding protein [Candidatus Krumholzibacteria bacterium]
MKIVRHPPWPLLLACLLLMGCGGGDAPDGGGPSAPADAPSRGGTAVIAFPAEPDVLNPLLYASAYSGMVMVLLNDSLVEMGEDFLYAPQIAASVTRDPDGLGLTAALRPWRWSDGSPLTAADVAASFQLIRDPAVASPRYGAVARTIVSVTAVAPDTVRYRFAEARADQDAALGHVLLPARLTADLDPAAVRSWPLNESPPSCGMFRLERWEHDRNLILARNEQYAGQAPLLDRLLLRIIPDETARFLELETGGVDMMTDIPPHLAKRLEGDPRFAVARTRGRLIGMVYWNHEDPLFQDVRVRKALSLAMDRQAIVDGLLGGYGQAAAGPIPPVVWAHDPAVAPDPLDPERARALLDAAGWRDRDGDGVRERGGRPLRFEIITRKGDPVRENAVVQLRENLAAVGVDARPLVLEFATAIDRVQAGDFAAYLGVFSARLSVDPSGLLGSDGFDRWNYGRYGDARADSLMRLGVALEDREAARPVWSAFQQLMAEEQPMAFLYHPDMLVAYDRRLRDVRPHVLSPFNNVREWWIAPADRRYPAAETSR